ncbi:MAG: transporter substrate-binding protein [Alphaproteobacteria bacterium]|jgi:peptide/nickel transport system substrate-binding protein|nr:transporter substrate-binding protein [Alphaproteobacteria bacterium]
MMRRIALLLLALLVAPFVAQAQTLQETPSLAADVQSGKLPSVAKRAPQQPLVVESQPGARSGGDINMLMASARDVRMMVVYGNARLVAYDDKLQLKPDLLEKIDIEEGRIFTLHLRQGHRWSDGQPFTTEDFRYWWDDVANNRELNLSGPPQDMLVDGEPPRIDIIDAQTIRYTWKQPNANFLPSIAGASPMWIFRPAHYLKKFHVKYADAKALEEAIEKERAGTWPRLHNKLDDMYRNENRDLPRLDPWIPTSRPPTQRFVFVRNPYYHRIDSKGIQLPYLDRVIMNIASGSLIPLKTGSGEADLQARYLRFDNFTFLKQGSKQYGFDVRLWQTARGSHMALFPNFNVADPEWRKVIRDVRFRRALSMAIDREEINEVLFLGLAIPANNTVLPASPLFKPEYQKAWAQFDVAAANKLLDELGLGKRDERGLRTLPDGRPLAIIVETAGENTEETDVLQLIHDSWIKIGVKLYSKPQSRDILRNRVFAGEALMSVWSGLENGVPQPGSSPSELAPTSQVQLQWPKWGQFFETGGRNGEAVDTDWGKELMALLQRWQRSFVAEEQTKIWHQMLQINIDQVTSIGIIAGVPQPVVVNNKLKNVPEKGIYNWDPGAFFGMYRPDSFWLAAQ